MKMEFVLDKEIIKMGLSNDIQNITATKRIIENKIIASNELLNIWETNAKENKYLNVYQGWLFARANQKGLFEKVDCSNELELVKSDNDEERITLATAKASNKKILIADYDAKVKNENKDIIIIKSNIFNKEKQQIIKSSDLENLIVHKNFDKIFDIYETPITIDISLNFDSSILAEFLSKFYLNSKKVIIKDKYLIQNESSLEQYIMPYIKKGETEIIFISSWDKHTKASYSKFTNYKGYKSTIKNEKKDLAHSSYIESDKYRIDVGYRLNIFGKNGKTNAETIRILKK
ncbi:hypothetical protein [Clostridium perfringens]|nr:hypothetical protein [Clostridium perfringens]MDK0686839.1 hypothetical protein [Clostridium perfringens]MDM0663321.1 hypothetical protein [Clostridium perfringens]